VEAKVMKRAILCLVLAMGVGCGSGMESAAEGDAAPSGVGGATGGSRAVGSGATGGSVALGSGGSGGSGYVPPVASAGRGGSFSTGGTGGTGTGGTSQASAGEASTPDEQYDDPGTQPFVFTAHDPLSTFAADVDTASYDIFRRDVEDGRLPDPASVRLEEYVNSFDYAYPAPSPDAEEPFAIHLAAAPSLSDTGTLLLRVGIQGKVAEPSAANIVFLVDTSGSMASPEKLPLVQLTLDQALNVLQPTDLVSIVTYSTTANVALPPTPVSEATAIRAVIGGLFAEGSTAGAPGIDLAYVQATAGFIEGGINHVVLCTDGDFNVGAYTNEELVELIERKRATGVTLTALGFGYGNLNDSMMEAVTNAGNGIYSVISSEDQAIRYANRDLLNTMIHIAKDMKIQVEFNPKQVLAYRLLGYENRALADDDFRDDVVDAGDIGAGHRVTALYEMVPVDGQVPSPEGAPKALDGAAYDGPVEVDAGAFALVKVRYKQPGASASDPAFEVNATLDSAERATSHAALDADFRWAFALASFAEILKGSPYASATSLDGIAAIVEADAAMSGDRAEFRALFEQVRARLETQ
jgi:Ca-activated chloride channel family protein